MLSGFRKFYTRTAGITKELVNAPVQALHKVARGYLRDGCRVKDMSVPAWCVGTAISTITIPASFFIVPASISSRCAKASTSYTGTIAASMLGATVGFVIVAFVGEVAVALYFFEVLARCATADEIAKEKELAAGLSIDPTSLPDGIAIRGATVSVS